MFYRCFVFVCHTGIAKVLINKATRLSCVLSNKITVACLATYLYYLSDAAHQHTVRTKISFKQQPTFDRHSLSCKSLQKDITRVDMVCRVPKIWLTITLLWASNSSSSGAEEDKRSRAREPETGKGSPPNLVFVLVDDVGWADFSYNVENGAIPTPG